MDTLASTIPAPTELGFDPADLRRRYAAERGKRLNKEGNDQYREVAGALARFDKDPYSNGDFSRPPVVEEIDALIVGAGIGGLLAAAYLRKAGWPARTLRIIDKAADFGGTWYWNRYPGVQCDIESYMYLPLLEETGYVPKEKYSFGPEILEYLQQLADRYNLYQSARFQTQVQEGCWDESQAHWVVTTDRGDVFKTRFVVISTGPLERPKLPGILGLETFRGAAFHTSRWDYGYTGGDPVGGDRTGVLDKLRDKRVGVFGTAASGIQIVPRLGADAKHLYVFQRTPSAIIPRGNRPTDPDWARSLTPGWQAERRHNFWAVCSGVPVEQDIVHDSWTRLFKGVAESMAEQEAQGADPTVQAALAEIDDFRAMNEVRAHVARAVRDPATADALMPWFGRLCKRPTISDDYLPTFNRPNVSLVDTGGKDVHISEHAVIVDGQSYEVDCLIFATGFEVGTAYTQRAQLEMLGREGVTLSQHWRDGMTTFQGFLTRGFPNCFHMGLTQTGFSLNFTHTLEAQAEHVAYMMERAKQLGARALEPSREAEAEWVALVSKPSFMTEYQKTCTPGYYNGEGKTEAHVIIQEYPGGVAPFVEALSKWREAGALEGLMLTS